MSFKGKIFKRGRHDGGKCDRKWKNENNMEKMESISTILKKEIKSKWKVGTKRGALGVQSIYRRRGRRIITFGPKLVLRKYSYHHT
jgi:hypothetical protein